MPDQAGLGVHLTLDMGGQARFGPDTQRVDTANHTVDPRRADAFYGALRRYWPQPPADALRPGYAGLRPTNTRPVPPAPDFTILGPAPHALPTLVNRSRPGTPGLTPCLAN